MNANAQLYRDLGATPVINAAGNLTVIGGSRLSPAVQEAMVAANRYYVSMDDLFHSTGERIASLLGAEAAFVTPGCGAALALSAGACMTVGHPERMELLPHTNGIPNQFLFQRRQKYHYQRCLTVFGGHVMMVGTQKGTTVEQLEDSITEQTAGIHYFASGDPDDSILDLEGILSVAGRHDLPVTVDAAYQVYPLDTMKAYASTPNALIGFGTKYIGAPNSTGILCGKKELVEAAYAQSFIGFETSDLETVGRPLKLDRQEVVAVVVALQEWLEMDHEARIAEHWRKADHIMSRLEGIPYLTTERHVEDNGLSNGVTVTMDEKGLGKRAAQVVEELKASDPSIWTRASGNRLRIVVAHLIEDEVDLVIDRVRKAVSC
ncbi:MAG: aminotransferase class V-fold PLP-dependent enzyme [bacterium]|nr:aminotransferase class V-fold PLP-dependent enzyme [bacterium]